jgi:sensor histidine kinase YesM
MMKQTCYSASSKSAIQPKKEQKEWKAKLNHVLYSTSSTLNVYSIETIFCIFCVILTILLSAVRYFISREISSYWPRNI